ncbi:MAG: hypothetical protein AAFO58_09405, partial [Pseudomonadota bacterium]
YRDIWKGAANLWWPVHATLTPEDLARHYDSVVRIGLTLTVTVGLAILAATWRTGPVTPLNRDAVLKLATISAAAVPFVLPKMHDRYFFMAEVMVLLLALTNRRYWPAVLLMQGSGALAYCGHEDILGFKALMGAGPMHWLSLALMVAAIACIFWPPRRFERAAPIPAE